MKSSSPIPFDEEKGTDLQLEHHQTSSFTDKDGFHVDAVEAADRPWSVDHEAALTKKLLWKLDLRILPMMAVLFLFSFLDRYARHEAVRGEIALTDCAFLAEQISATPRFSVSRLT